MSDQELETRMRGLERYRALRIRLGGWPVVRLDGRFFHRFTRGRFEKPFDERSRDLMILVDHLPKPQRESPAGTGSTEGAPGEIRPQ